MRFHAKSLVFLVCHILAANLLSGCAAGPRHTDSAAMPVTASTLTDREIRALPMYRGDDGTMLDWHTFLGLIEEADIVILGEQHDDAVAHAVQLAVVTDAAVRWQPIALTLEMLERDEQLLVDDYADEIIDADQFAKLTFSENWGGKGSWTAWYQPIIDAALDGGGRVIAANAPRRYVRLARTDGWERLDALDSQRRAWVQNPKQLLGGKYRERFWEVMGGNHSDDAEDDSVDPDEDEQLNERLEAVFRSQLVWDATMAASLARAKNDGAAKVIHLVGQFHSDFNGGTVQLLREAQPDARILTVSMQRAAPDALREEDLDRADIVIYTLEN